MLRVPININMNSKLAGTTMSKISFEGMVALNGILLKTSRVDCSKRRDQTGSFQSHHSFKRDLTHGCTRKFTIRIYVYSYSYSSHHAKLQTPFM